MCNRQERIRVLFVGHTYLVSVNQRKLDALARTGVVDVALLAPERWKQRDWNRIFELERPFGTIRIFPAPVLFNGIAGAYLYDPLAVCKAISRFRPDIVQVEQEVFSLCALQLALIAKLYRRPVVFFGWENLDRSLSFIRRMTRRTVLSLADAVICGNGDNETLVRRWGYRGPTVIMPQLGVDTDLFAPAHRKRCAEFTAGYLGRLVYEKGIDILLSSLAILRERGRGIHLMVCAEGPLRQELVRRAHEKNLSQLVSWREPVPHSEVPQVMAELDVLVLPSRTVARWKEQFGHVLIEAMAMGIPVVGSSCGEIPNVIGRQDLIFAENDPRELAEILERMVQDDEWRAEVSQYVAERVSRLYTHETIAKRLVSVYRNLLGSQAESDMS